MRNRDTRVVELFHEDAVLVGLGTLTKGRAAIADFYRGVVEGASPSPRLAGPLMVSGGRVAGEVYIDFPSGATIHAVDIFEIEDGLIRTLTYFLATHPNRDDEAGETGFEPIDS